MQRQREDDAGGKSEGEQQMYIVITSAHSELTFS
jgi:hypothetical protein